MSGVSYLGGFWYVVKVARDIRPSCVFLYVYFFQLNHQPFCGVRDETKLCLKKFNGFNVNFVFLDFFSLFSSPVKLLYPLCG